MVHIRVCLLCCKLILTMTVNDTNDSCCDRCTILILVRLSYSLAMTSTPIISIFAHTKLMTSLLAIRIQRVKLIAFQSVRDIGTAPKRASTPRLDTSR